MTPHNPTLLARMDLHSGLANTAALRAAGITAETGDPPGGIIARGAGGAPTGLLADAAMQLVTGERRGSTWGVACGCKSGA